MPASGNFVTSGTRKETKGLQEQISVLQKANTEAQMLRNG